MYTRRHYYSISRDALPSGHRADAMAMGHSSDRCAPDVQEPTACSYTVPATGLAWKRTRVASNTAGIITA